MTMPNGMTGQQDGIALDTDKVLRRLLGLWIEALTADQDTATERVGAQLLESVKWREACEVQGLELAKAQAEITALRDAAKPAGATVIDAPDPT